MKTNDYYCNVGNIKVELPSTFFVSFLIKAIKDANSRIQNITNETMYWNDSTHKF
jgi:hypothetical protein